MIISPQQHDDAQMGPFCCCARFWHPSHTKCRLADAVPDPEHFEFSLFQGPPKRNRGFRLPIFPPRNSRSRIFCGPPTQQLNFSIGFPHPYSWHFLGAVLGHLGAFLGPSWAILGALLGPFWAILGPYSSCSASGAPFRAEMWGPVAEDRKRHFLHNRQYKRP